MPLVTHVFKSHLRLQNGRIVATDDFLPAEQTLNMTAREIVLSYPSFRLYRQSVHGLYVKKASSCIIRVKTLTIALS